MKNAGKGCRKQPLRPAPRQSNPRKADASEGGPLPSQGRDSQLVEESVAVPVVKGRHWWNKEDLPAGAHREVLHGGSPLGVVTRAVL